MTIEKQSCKHFEPGAAVLIALPLGGYLKCVSCDKLWRKGDPDYNAIHEVFEKEAEANKLNLKMEEEKIAAKLAASYSTKPGKIIPIDKPPSKKHPILVMPQFKAETVSLSQEIIMRVGMMSACNVAIQHFVSGGISADYRLFCKSCKATKMLDDFIAIHKGDEEMVKIIDAFCMDHRHGAGIPIATAQTVVVQTEGRKYRDE